MQVACNSCGAQYEFDASAIPAEGYDAQCTSCSAIFFVAPESSQTRTDVGVPDGAQVSVSCSHCGAIYQFAAADIPAGGYDAQCTQCQGVFFVSPEAAGPTATPGFEAAATQTTIDISAHTQAMAAAAASTAPSPGPNPASGLPEPAEQIEQISTGEFSIPEPTLTGIQVPKALQNSTNELQVPAPSEQTNGAYVPAATFNASGNGEAFDEVSGVMEVSTGAQDQASASGARLPPGGRDSSDDTEALAQEYSADLGQPMRGWSNSSNAAMVASDIDLEDDPGTRGGAKPLFKAVGVLVVLGATAFGVVKGQEFLPAQSKPAAPPLRPPSDAAKAAFARGQKSMLDDTVEGYKAANSAFVDAINMSPDYTEAMTWASVSQTLLGSDKLLAGRAAFQFSRDKLAEAQSLAAATAGKVKPRDAGEVEAHVQQLQRTAQAAQQKATELLESGGKALSDGEVLLLRARRLGGEDAVIADAQAIWYVSQPAGASLAAQALVHADGLRQAPAGQQAATPQAPAPWFHALVQARLAAMETGTESQAVAALKALSQKAPQVVRARWELADTLSHSGQKNEARDVAHTILAGVPAHAKALALMQSLGAAPAAQSQDEAVASGEPVPDDIVAPPLTKPGKGKAKGKNKRKH